jgi:transcriptional regulator with XRE-family HTH domain
MKSRMAELITESTCHKSVNGQEMLLRRTKAGLTLEQVAEQMSDILGRESISKQYIWKLETPEPDGLWVHEVPAEVAEALEQILPE